MWLPGCTTMTAVSAVPGTLLNAVASQFSGEKESFPRNVQPTLAAVQLTLRSMKLEADVLEIQASGYGIAFNNGALNGKITLEKMTARLTTVDVRVRSRMREASVERAMMDSIRTRLKHISRDQRFHFAGYHNLRAKPGIKAQQLGWYRPEARLNTHQNGKSDWLELKLPSGRTAYLKADTAKLARM